jgi:hypothetical protein
LQRWSINDEVRWKGLDTLAHPPEERGGDAQERCDTQLLGRLHLHLEES